MLVQFALLLMVLNPLQTADPLASYRDEALSKWETEIQALEKLDQEQVDPEHGILFIGSSSIRLWADIAQDMAPYATIRRGYGGAKFSDLAVFVERLVKPHKFDGVVIFVANDIAGDKSDKTPQEVIRLVEITVGKIQQLAPQAPVFLIAITPTPARFKVWEQIKSTNAEIEQFCQRKDGVYFIDTVDRYLDAEGQPIEGYFTDDRLHQNRSGYQVWSETIKAAIAPVLPAYR